MKKTRPDEQTDGPMKRIIAGLETGNTSNKVMGPQKIFKGGLQNAKMRKCKNMPKKREVKRKINAERKLKKVVSILYCTISANSTVFLHIETTFFNFYSLYWGKEKRNDK